MMRADPENRLPGRVRVRREALVRRAVALWRMAGRSALALPASHAAALLAWALADGLAVREFTRAHLGLGLPSAGEWQSGLALRLAIAVAALVLGPPIVLGLLSCMIHRRMLNGARTAWWPCAGRALALTAALWLLTLFACAGYAAVLLAALPAIGPTSTLLTAILLLPLPVGVVIASVRMLTGLPAASLGLPRAAAEGWMISTGRVGPLLGMAVIGLGPLLILRAALSMTRLGGFAVPVMDIAAFSWTGCLTADFYRRFRVPAALRPDRRPSRNRAARQEPALRRPHPS